MLEIDQEMQPPPFLTTDFNHSLIADPTMV